MDNSCELPRDPATPGFGFLVVVDDRNVRHRTLVVSGEIDLATTMTFGVLLRDQLDWARGSGELDLDLARVVFFSAAGLRTLLRAAETARRGGIVFRLSGVSPAVEHVLDLTGTRHRLGLAPPADTARLR